MNELYCVSAVPAFMYQPVCRSGTKQSTVGFKFATDEKLGFDACVAALGTCLSACSALSLPHKHQSISVRPSLPLTSRWCVYCRAEGERVGGGSPAAVRGHAATARRAGRVHDRALQGRPAQAQQGTPTPTHPAAGLPRKHTFGISHTAIFTPSCRNAEVFTCAHSMSFSLTSCARTDLVYTIHDMYM